MRRLSARHQVYVTRIGYFLCGFAVACWAPLIPIIQDHLSLSTEAISLLVLSFGIGSVSGMIISGFLLQWIGFKLTYAISCFTTAASICLLALMPNYEIVFGALIVFGISIGCLEVVINVKLTYAISCFTTAASICLLALMPNYEIVFGALIVFGISIGCLEVVINVFAAYIEKKYRIMMMSVLFGYYSMGEVVGALMMMFLLTLNVAPSMAILSLISIIYVASAYYIPVIISIKSADKKENKTFVRPVQPVISLALIIAFTYMVGGAILDWSGLYVTKDAGVPLNFASYGYCIVAACMLLCRLFSKSLIKLLGTFNCAFFGALMMIVALFIMVASYGYCIVAACMLLCRLFSKSLIKLLGTFNCAFFGALMMIVALFIMVLIPNIYIITLCFFAIGIGMSNISPLTTSATGAQKNMPLVPAISFLSICGYTGLLLGPALLGIGIGMSNISPLTTSATGAQKNMPLVPAISFLSICGYTGLLLGPALLGFIATHINLSGIFYFLSGLTAISALLIYSCKPQFKAIDPRSSNQNSSQEQAQ